MLCCDVRYVTCIDWKPLYQPSKEQEEEDRKRAYESGVPHGYVPRGFKYEGLPTIKINITSELVRSYYAHACGVVWGSAV